MAPKHTPRGRLADWVARTGLTHQGAAERLGVKRSHITHVLSGRRSPSLPLAVRIQHEAGIPAVDWVNRDEAVV